MWLPDIVHLFLAVIHLVGGGFKKKPATELVRRGGSPTITLAFFDKKIHWGGTDSVTWGLDRPLRNIKHK